MFKMYDLFRLSHSLKNKTLIAGKAHGAITAAADRGERLSKLEKEAEELLWVISGSLQFMSLVFQFQEVYNFRKFTRYLSLVSSSFV